MVATDYVKASNVGAGDRFGTAVALDRDGIALVVGAPNEDSAATSVGGEQTSDAHPDAGAAYVFTRTSPMVPWAQRAYLKGDVSVAGAELGRAVAITPDASRIAVGAPLETEGGIVCTFRMERAEERVLSESCFRGINTGAQDEFGSALAFSPNGNHLLVGAPREASAAIGFDGDDNSRNQRGAAYLFGFDGEGWSQRQYLKPLLADARLEFGRAVAVSNAPLLVVGAPGDPSSALGEGDHPRAGALLSVNPLR